MAQRDAERAGPAGAERSSEPADVERAGAEPGNEPARWVELIREAARSCTQRSWFGADVMAGIGALLEDVARREEQYRVIEPGAEPPGPGDEAYVGLQLARLLLGRPR